MNENHIKKFMLEIQSKAESGGWPVNAGDIGGGMFGEDAELAAISTRNVVKECRERGYFTPTFEGDIHGLDPAGQAYVELHKFR